MGSKEPSLHWFRTRGSRGLAFGRLDSGTDLRVVVVESFIDAISFAQLFHQEGDLYVSTAGAVSSKQVWQMAALATANPQACWVAATDADHGGDAIALTLAGIALGRVVRQRPSAKDWNEVLQLRRTRTGYVGVEAG